MVGDKWRGNDMIIAQNVSKRYNGNERQILSEVDLTFESGEFRAVMGESGSGKSTLLAVLGGILKPDSGRVILSRYGENDAEAVELYSLSDEELSKIHREKLGIVPQGNFFLKNYTVSENLIIPFLLKDNLGELRERAGELLETLGVKDRANRRTYELSGGEQKRVALARALMTDPKVIIADEPTTGLDACTGERILTFLKSQADNGKTVIVATHDEHVRSYATGVVDITRLYKRQNCRIPAVSDWLTNNKT